MVIVVRIPATPSIVLSPNSRVHWATRMREVARFREMARVATLATTSAADRERIAAAASIGYRLRVSWEPGRRGVRDEDNLLASCKSALDGVADAFGIDDAKLHVRGIEIDRESREGVTVLTMEIEA